MSSPLVKIDKEGESCLEFCQTAFRLNSYSYNFIVYLFSCQYQIFMSYLFPDARNIQNSNSPIDLFLCLRCADLTTTSSQSIAVIRLLGLSNSSSTFTPLGIATITPTLNILLLSISPCESKSLYVDISVTT